MFTRVACRLAKSRPSKAVLLQARFLNLQEYVSKGLLSQYGVSIQRGKPASSADEAEAVAATVKEMTGTNELVIKAQILAGGRGKGTFDNGFKGGVKIAKTPAEIKSYAQKMLGANLRTEQTPPEGIPVHKVLVAECIDIKRECYFAIVMDRVSGGPVMIASKRGGMNIEEVARDHPEDIITTRLDIMEGAVRSKTLPLAEKLGFHGDMAVKAADEFEKVFELFMKADVTQVEINPLAETTDERVVAVDAKINFDENAAYRQEDIFKQHDPSEDDPREIAAAKYNLNYVGLSGNIGCMVNGAGLAMATMDIIKLHGGEPANFLDVGGGATARQVTEAFKILTADPKVQVILVNIFGGIMRCDVIAEGIITASKSVGVKVPIVVRLEGTNVSKGKEMLRESGIRVVTADSLDEAADKAVSLLGHNQDLTQTAA